MKIFRRNDDRRRLAEHQQLLRALGTVVGPSPMPEQPASVVVEPELAPVISLAALRARRVGHPSGGGSTAPVTARR